MRAEDTSLRRLERDIHDGPQQRLLRLQMELSAAERRLRSDPEAAAAPLTAARGMAADALEELRALSRGVAPPILQDRGLSAALVALGDRGPVRTDVRLGDRVPEAIERSAYFIAAELVANALKHAEGTPVMLRARTEAELGRPTLTVAVQDAGAGGARVLPGHGLAAVPRSGLHLTLSEFLTSGVGLVQRLENRVSGVEKLLLQARDDLARAEVLLAETDRRSGRPFRHLGALMEEERSVRRLERLLRDTPPPHQAQEQEHSRSASFPRATYVQASMPLGPTR